MRVALRRRLEALRSEPLSLAADPKRSSTLAVARFWRALRCHPGSAAEVVVGNPDTRGHRPRRLQWLHP